MILKENATDQLGRNEMIAVKILELLILCDRMFTAVEAVGWPSTPTPSTSIRDISITS